MRLFGWLLTLVPLALPAAPAAAQQTCDGKTVSTVEIVRSDRTLMDKAHAPPWSRALLQPLLLGTPTLPSAIKPFLQLRAHGPCTEQRRAESERILRLQPFLATASVRIVDEEHDSVRVIVETSDDLRPIVGLGVRGGLPTQLELGSTNVAGRGQLAAVRWRDGRAYRDGFGVRFKSYHLLGGPNVATLQFDRQPLGTSAIAAVERPFFTELQEFAAYAGYVHDNDYVRFVRPAADPLGVTTSRSRVDAGVALRLRSSGSVRVLAGTVVSVERRATGRDLVVISDSGFVPFSALSDTTAYPESQATRLGVVGGLRALSFVKVAGFDALEGAQDVARGLQVATTIGRTLGGAAPGPYVTSDLYAGVGHARSFLGVRTQVETRRVDGAWGRVVGSGRLAWYSRPSAQQTRIWSMEFAGAWRHDVPYQLSLDDPESGIRGYAGSRLAGGRRLIVRAERRLALPGIARYAGWGVAAFADAAQVWKGEIPVGRGGTRASIGVSALAAVPRASRGMGRVDIAIPLVPDGQARALSLRLSYRIIGREFWRDPAPLARSRAASPASSIFTWP